MSPSPGVIDADNPPAGRPPAGEFAWALVDGSGLSARSSAAPHGTTDQMSPNQAAVPTVPPCGRVHGCVYPPKAYAHSPWSAVPLCASAGLLSWVVRAHVPSDGQRPRLLLQSRGRCASGRLTRWGQLGTGTAMPSSATRSGRGRWDVPASGRAGAVPAGAAGPSPPPAGGRSGPCPPRGPGPEPGPVAPTGEIDQRSTASGRNLGRLVWPVADG